MARKPGANDVPDTPPEKHGRRGDAADALFRAVAKAATRPALSPRCR
jgi:hypothetical protein